MNTRSAQIINQRHGVGEEVFVKSREMLGTVYSFRYEVGYQGNNEEALTKPIKESFQYYVKTIDGRLNWYDENIIWFPDLADKLAWKAEKALVEVSVNMALDNWDEESFKLNSAKLLSLLKNKPVEEESTT